MIPRKLAWSLSMFAVVTACGSSGDGSNSSSGSSGSSSAAGSGTTSSDAASGSSGTSTSGATSSGGTSGSSGGGTSGSSSGVDASVDASGDAGAVSDESSVLRDGGADVTTVVSGDAGICSSCGPTSVCVESQTLGGAVIVPDDAGQCPQGYVVSAGPPARCNFAPSYECRLLPSACNTAPGSTAIAHCTCAASLCQAGDRCTDVSPTLMLCQLLAP
ncbi:MAG TPA: hypothetical protein VKU41_33125 [Polyangiaceae bacterium]|nr:hypothetical protein [Polyangiaceae bacterium]